MARKTSTPAHKKINYTSDMRNVWIHMDLTRTTGVPEVDEALQKFAGVVEQQSKLVARIEQQRTVVLDIQNRASAGLVNVWAEEGLSDAALDELANGYGKLPEIEVEQKRLAVLLEQQQAANIGVQQAARAVLGLTAEHGDSIRDYNQREALNAFDADLLGASAAITDAVDRLDYALSMVEMIDRNRDEGARSGDPEAFTRLAPRGVQSMAALKIGRDSLMAGLATIAEALESIRIGYEVSDTPGPPNWCPASSTPLTCRPTTMTTRSMSTLRPREAIVTDSELRRLRTLRADPRRDDDEEAEYRILMKLAALEVESAELRLIELRSLSADVRVPIMSADDNDNDNDAEDFGDWDGRDD